MDRLKDIPVTVSLHVDKTFNGRFRQNEKKIRELATADPNSYAAVVVRSMDHFTKAQELMEEYLNQNHLPCCVFSNSTNLKADILKELSMSTRASELFANWTPSFQSFVKNMGDETLTLQGNRKSDLDLDARVCYATIISQSDPAKAIKIMDESRKKYPNEVYFHRVYCDLFLYTKDLDAGLKASEEVSKLFPNDANVLHSRAGFLRIKSDSGGIPDYKNWALQKKQIEVVKEAYKNYIKVAPKDHRQFAECNHVLAYLSLKYSTPSSQISQTDLQEISFHFQNGLNAEVDILPCFLPFNSHFKKFVTKNVNMEPTTHIYLDGDTCSIDLTRNGMPGRPKPKTLSTENVTFIDVRKPTQRRIDVCVPHRQLLKSFLSDPAFALLAQNDDDQNSFTNIPPPNNNKDSDEFEDIILYQMTFFKKSQKFTSKVMHLTVAEDSLYSIKSGFFEMVIADTTGDVIKLKLDLGGGSPDSQNLKKMMKKFRFGTVWSLRNPDFHMENGDEKTMYIRAIPESLISNNDSQDGGKCRYCFKLLSPGQQCSKCKRAAYCGKECQTQDWKYIKHSFICSETLNNFYK